MMELSFIVTNMFDNIFIRLAAYCSLQIVEGSKVTYIYQIMITNINQCFMRLPKLYPKARDNAAMMARIINSNARLG